VPITPALKRVYASAPQDTGYIQTLELTHPNFPQRYFITNDVKAWVFALEDGTLQQFLAIPFAVIEPSIDGKGQQDLQIGIENIGRETMDAIELASFRPEIPISLVFRVYLNRPNSPPQNDPPLRLSLSNITVGLDAVTGTATRADTLNRMFPSVVYRTDTYPGLDR
jgi:Domain of unknown function (DUF1833)